MMTADPDLDSLPSDPDDSVPCCSSCGEQDSASNHVRQDDGGVPFCAAGGAWFRIPEQGVPCEVGRCGPVKQPGIPESLWVLTNEARCRWWREPKNSARGEWVGRRACDDCVPATECQVDELPNGEKVGR